MMALANSDAVVAQVLKIMVQHVESLNTRDVARLLQLSSTCRRALQQAVGCLKIDRLNSVVATTGFAAWLPQHAGLLQKLELVRPDRAPASAASAEASAGWAAAGQLIVFALQASSTTPGASAAAPGAPLRQPASLLRLQSFNSSYVHSPAALRSLASCSHLTELGLSCVPQERFTAAFCGAIGQLRSLRKLCCCAATAPGTHFVYPLSFAAAVAQLTQLEELDALDSLPFSCLQQLPSSLAKAYLDVEYTGGRSPTDINISHLSRLHSLELSIVACVSSQSQLPDSLTALTLLSAADAIPGLGQLQVLNVRNPAACLPLMQRLQELPRLKHVLVGLQHCEPKKVDNVLAALSKGTQLTGLQLYLRNPSNERDGLRPDDELGHMQYIWLHPHFVQLPQLQLLHISGLELDPIDVVHYTSFTTLTDLKIAHCLGELDLGIAAMMQRLTGLRKLHLESLGLSSDLIWVAAACLTNLQQLKVMVCRSITITDQTLHLLAPLTSLTQLVLDHGHITYDSDGDEYFHGVSDAAERQLLSQLPLLDRIKWV